MTRLSTMTCATLTGLAATFGAIPTPGVFTQVVFAQGVDLAAGRDKAEKKELDDKLLSPVRPIRRVGPDTWPEAKPGAQAEADKKRAEADKKKAEAEKKAAEKKAADSKPGASTTGQAVAGDKPDRTAAPGSNPAVPAAALNSAPPAGAFQAPATPAAPQQAAQSEGQTQGFASVRLGTDASGKVLINDDQERQIGRVLRAQNVRAIEESVSVKVGETVPASVRLGAVSSGLVEILPQFRGYSFFATREEIFIVEPASKKVVALLPVKVTATASRPTNEKPVAEKKPMPERPATVGLAPAEERPAAALAPSRRDTRARDLSSVQEAIERDITRDRGGYSRTYRAGEPERRTIIIQRRSRGEVFVDDAN